jgi:hypothetical protein
VLEQVLEAPAVRAALVQASVVAAARVQRDEAGVGAQADSAPQAKAQEVQVRELPEEGGLQVAALAAAVAGQKEIPLALQTSDFLPHREKLTQLSRCLIVYA